MDPFHILKVAVFSVAASAGSLFAQQDQIIFTTGQPPLAGKIERVANGQVMINIGVGSRPVPLQQIKSVTMTPPPAYNQAMVAYEAREYEKALQLLRSSVDQYKGLPAEWVQRGMGMIGDLYVELNQIPRAQQEYAEFEKFYPNAKSSERMVVMKAKMNVATKKFAEAKAVLEPMAKAALDKKEVSAQDGATYGQVFLVMGQIYESEKKLPEALESYLRTVTVFYQDPTASAAAQAKADALRDANKTLVAP